MSFAKVPMSAVGSGRSRPSPSAPLERASADQAVQQFAVASGVAEAPTIASIVGLVDSRATGGWA